METLPTYSQIDPSVTANDPLTTNPVSVIVPDQPMEPPSYSPANPLLPSRRIFIKTIQAHKASYLRFEFPLEMPNWYSQLDTLSPGYHIGIQLCNQALVSLSTRRLIFMTYQLSILMLAIISIILYTGGFLRVNSIYFYSAMFAILFILFVTRPFIVKYILEFQSPMIDLRNKVTDMGWTLNGFEEAHRNSNAIPEITVTRYVFTIDI
jgi:hypothetical protein